MLRVFRTVAFLSCTGLSAVTAYGQQSDLTTEWIRANAIRLGTTEAGHGFADMQALKPLIGNARIVALGEATHGTREFFQLKHRMLEFLATETADRLYVLERDGIQLPHESVGTSDFRRDSLRGEHDGGASERPALASRRRRRVLGVSTASGMRLRP
jgi:hypothetical protein